MTATMPDRRAGPFERLAGWLKLRRDRLVADPAFQRFSASFPLTRGTAHRHASDLFDLCAGFVYSQVLFACVRLDLFAMLTRGPLPLSDIAARARLSPEAADRLVRAAIALGLLEWRGDMVGLGLKGAALTGNPGALAMVEHHAMLYADLADPIALLRGEAPPSLLRRFWAYGDGGSAEAADSAADYTALMARSQALVADDILDAYPVDKHRVVLDVGGGNGTFLAALHRRAPAAELHLFDLPAVTAHAAHNPALPESVVIHGGRFPDDPLPAGMDLVTLVRVVHDHDDAVVRPLLKRVHEALVPGGSIVIAEPMAESAAVAPMADAYFGFYLLAMGQGRARSPDTLMTMLVEAGFQAPRRVATRRPLFAGLVTATRHPKT